MAIILPITTPADFVGDLAISKNTFKEDKLKEYIDTYEKYYIRYLFSDQAYKDISTLDPCPDKYTDLINGTEWNDPDDDNKLRIVQGFKQVLLYFIYFHYVADNWQNTIVGNTQNIQENSKRVQDNANKQIVYNRYNQGIEIYECEIVPFINEYYKITEAITGFVDNGGGSYTIQTASTKYLYDGDTVTIDNIEYVIDSLVADTSFNITASEAGLTFSGNFIYYPYYEYNLFKIRRSWL